MKIAFPITLPSIKQTIRKKDIVFAFTYPTRLPPPVPYMEKIAGKFEG
jgi:hypothetical protein